ncbi:hypothetical protein RHGRI_027035 [Rhododendron griersonianum]|uniref:F-box domain-containing protein n=1 Tax=Rhododendron griersonianum TaxID=479676 RepID=A0AAV6IZC0_9ERIC|nr:hypothetical protein RHGRI_027035 [Rhododendron griersonianum]
MFQSEETLTKLLSVNIDCLRGLKPQLLLIKLFLGCSPKLETLFVALSSQLDLNERFKISKELSQFPRLSPKASTMSTSSDFGRKDIISDLPRNIIESILERMPIRDAARTSILSSKWRYIWTTISQLVLDDQFFEETFRIKPIVQRELAIAVENILLLRNGPIQKFVLCLPVLQFSCCSDIDDQLDTLPVKEWYEGSHT